MKTKISFSRNFQIKRKLFLSKISVCKNILFFSVWDYRPLYKLIFLNSNLYWPRSKNHIFIMYISSYRTPQDNWRYKLSKFSSKISYQLFAFLENSVNAFSAMPRQGRSCILIVADVTTSKDSYNYFSRWNSTSPKIH